MNKQKLKFIDLFAGIGGFHQAFHELGCECVFASEIDEAARLTYERNFIKISPNLFKNNLFNKDIRSISPSEIPDFDILCGGFPCQPFSQAGLKQGFSDGRDSERGNLFFNIVDIIEAKQPKAFFLENVRGIVNHDNGRTFKIIREILEEELGYSFYFQIVKATDYGLPQHRPRAFMIGFRDENFLKSFNFPPKIPLKFNMSDVFGGECSREIGFTLRVGGAGSNINDRRNWDSYLVDGEVVRIQPNEALKIQGFPSDFSLPNSRTAAMKQLGNSVAVDAVKACAKSLINHLSVIVNQQNERVEKLIKRNKGEWAETYSFLKCVLDKKIFLADSSLNATGDFFEIHKVTTLNLDEELFLDELENDALDQADLDMFKDRIIEGKKTFTDSQSTFILNELGISAFSGGNSHQKADIVLDISHEGTRHNDEGFGIKSYLASKPTLLNASGANTNFIYEIKNFNDESLEAVNNIDSKTKLKDRIKSILKLGGELEFSKIESETMHYNLNLLDSELPEIASKLLLNFYLNRRNLLSDNLENLHSQNQFAEGLSDHDSHKIKVKRFLVAILLGLFAGTKWDGKFSSNGTIVVKADGSQVAFHIIKLDVLENYLFNIIKFDTPSTTRHRFGSVFKERDGKFFFKLNMQLRF
ncbi:HpaII family restriction endonuclease [Gammaproteobacteria bacterium]|nr:HpaII family restriction endonuclease [Gammaproteobacteria bacterium]